MITAGDVDVVFIPVLCRGLQGLSLDYQRRGVRRLALRRHDNVFCPEKKGKRVSIENSLSLVLSHEIKSRNHISAKPSLALFFYSFFDAIQFKTFETSEQAQLFS